MAEIDVKVKGDNADFKAKLSESAAEAHEFSAHIKEELAGAGSAAADILKENNLGGIPKMFGTAEVAAASFGAAVVDMFKDSIKAAMEWETNVKGIATALGTAQAGLAEDVLKFVESMSGHMGSLEENSKVIKELFRIKIPVAEAERDLIEIQNIAKATGSSVEEIGRAFAELKTGEIPRGFFRENLAIKALAQSMLPAAPPAPLKPGQTAPEAEEEALTARVTAAGGAQWLLRRVLPMVAPGGMQAAVRTAPETTAEQWSDLQVKLEQLSQELGKELLPVIKEFYGDLKANLPGIGENLRSFGERLRTLMEGLRTLETPGKAIAGFFENISPMPYLAGVRTPEGQKPAFWEGIFRTFQTSSNELRDAAKEHRETMEEMHRKMQPKD